MLHDVQRILGISIEGSLPVEPADRDWQLGLAGQFGWEGALHQREH